MSELRGYSLFGAGGGVGIVALLLEVVVLGELVQVVVLEMVVRLNVQVSLL